MPPISHSRASRVPVFQHLDRSDRTNPTSRPSAQKSMKMSQHGRLREAPSKVNIIFNSPPHLSPAKKSIQKTAWSSSKSPSQPSLNCKLNMISIPPPESSPFCTDSMTKRQPLMSKFRPPRALFPTSWTNSPNAGLTELEFPALLRDEGGVTNGSFNSRDRGAHSLLARKHLLDAAPIHDSRILKKMKTGEIPQEQCDPETSFDLPSPNSFPPLYDDGTKPPHSYAQLIAMSILRAPNRRLTLAQIYKWISGTFRFYSATDAGWQNSIRHNLSLNKAFVKQERPKDDPGKGNYWVIKPGMEQQFIKERITARKAAASGDSLPVLPDRNMANSTLPASHHMISTIQNSPGAPDHTKYPAPDLEASAEISSDATIPNSDMVDPELKNDSRISKLSSPQPNSSPINAQLHSSPPMICQFAKDTPLPVSLRSSRSGCQQPNFTHLDDSGYYSSFESSAVRRSHHFISDPEPTPARPRGRAEEEIARLRCSSNESPSMIHNDFPMSISSSIGTNQVAEPTPILTPLTPAVKLNAPTRAPPSASPNTNLRRHRDRVREMVGSPLRGMTTLEETFTWSPAFSLEENGYMLNSLHDMNSEIDIFNDAVGRFPTLVYGSPEKRSLKRSRLDQSRFINESGEDPSLNLRSSPEYDLPMADSMKKSSPSPRKISFDENIETQNKFDGYKMPDVTYETKKSFQGDYGIDSKFLHEECGTNWDMMQGFQKIGNERPSGTYYNKDSTNPTRPGFVRSCTSQF